MLSGQAERESIMRALPVTHQFLHKPCDGDTLRAVIEQTHNLHKLMQNPALTALVGKLERIPAVPTTYTELSRLAQDPKADASSFAKVIEMDAAVCAKVLQKGGLAWAVLLVCQGQWRLVEPLCSKALPAAASVAVGSVFA